MLKKIIKIDNYDFAKNNFVLDVPLKFKNPFKVPIKNKRSYIMNCFKIAIDLAKKREVAGFINCPINKFETFGLRTMGITEFLAKKEKVLGKEAMLIYNKSLSVSPITTHIKIKNVSKKITKQIIIDTSLTINNFYELPEYEDEKENSFQNLQYYQLRWCKHIYAAMWSLVHDEGNEPLKLAAKYEQSGVNITVNFDDHNLNKNDKIQLNFTSGNAISGEYTITDVPNPNSFVVVYPFDETTSGYVTVENLKKHEYVGAWLLEPNDKPIGQGLEAWERNWKKESEKLRESAEIFALYNRSTKWEGNKEIIGNFNNKQNVANFDPSVVAMTLTDSLKRDAQGGLDRSGQSLNTTNRMIAMVNKLFNKSPTVLDDIKFGIINKPLIEFTDIFESGLINAGDYINGELVDSAVNTSDLDASTYTPNTAQDTVVDAGLYINVE